MNPHVAERLYDELFIAGVAFYLAGRPLSVSLRQQARRPRGAIYCTVASYWWSR